MMRHITLAAAIASAMIASGCNKHAESPSPKANSEATHQHDAHDQHAATDGADEHDREAPLSAAARQALAPTATPDEVVLAFLEATRSGDEVLASKLLSKKALEETTKAGLIVKPPGTPSMQYEIGAVEYPESTADGAYVQSIWRERFADGEDRFDITWVLRRQPDGWRIVGMALPGNDLVNFEQPDALRQKMEEAQQDSPTDPAAEDSEAGADEDMAAEEPAEGAEETTAERLSSPPRNLR